MSHSRLLRADAEDSRAAALRALHAGDPIVIPTDAGYVLGADALVDEAVEALRAATRRPADVPIPICVADVEDIHHVADATPFARRLAARHWPGPLTLVLRARPWLPESLTAGHPTVAVRIAAHAWAESLARDFGPLAVARPHRHARIASAEDAAAATSNALVFDAGRLAPRAPTVMDARDSEGKILREGAVPAHELAGHD